MRAAPMLLVALPLFAQPSDLPPPPKLDPLPASARPVVERCEKSLAEAKKIYETACAKARIQAIRELEPAIKTETQKGNLDGAMAIRAKTEEYKKDSAKPEPEVKASIVGRWTWCSGRTAIFRADGTANQFLNSNKFGDGKWKETKGTIEAKWHEIEGGGIFTDTITLDGDTGKVVNKDLEKELLRPFRFEIKRLPDKE